MSLYTLGEAYGGGKVGGCSREERDVWDLAQRPEGGMNLGSRWNPTLIWSLESP